jgi:alkanesulfonate monooxygenase SsuD/methylene tetrahydromethanopterin reductase-like flavin-dependent oxidoreductase (luciferase family)
MELGVHLPLLDFDDERVQLDDLVRYVDTARDLGYRAVAANDHLAFGVPWLDGPTALAAVTAATGTMDLFTTVILPVVRGPVPVAKAMAALDVLSGGRLTVAVGPGSSPADYAAVGIDFAERWARLDESILALRALWQRDRQPFRGQFYATDDLDLRPLPVQDGGPRIWSGSWGSEAGLRRTARLADGWLASAYNTTPALFADALGRLGQLLVEEGRDPTPFRNGLSTMWFAVTDTRAEAERILHDLVVPAIHRPVEVLRDRLPIGSADDLADKLAAFRDAGVQRVFLWPIVDASRQLELVHERVPSFAR